MKGRDVKGWRMKDGDGDLLGGFNFYFIFLNPYPGEMIPFEAYFSTRFKVPTSNGSTLKWVLWMDLSVLFCRQNQVWAIHQHSKANCICGHPIILTLYESSWHTVDGWISEPLIDISYCFECLYDVFIHPRWCRISAINSSWKWYTKKLMAQWERFVVDAGGVVLDPPLQL